MEERHKLIGNLLTNIWSLETILRYLILAKKKEILQQIGGLNEGDTLSENSYTNYFQLNNLIEIYNTEYCSTQEEKINKERIIKIRDVLHHGRVFITDLTEEYKGIGHSNYYYLVKFSPVNNGKVYLTDKIDLDSDDYQWIRESKEFIKKTIEEITSRNHPEAINYEKGDL